jgi:Flp pilus assembly pilin Flp
MPSSISTAVARLTRPARESLSDTRATTAIEYALLASCVAVGIATVVVGIGSNLKENFYQKVLDALPS